VCDVSAIAMCVLSSALRASSVIVRSSAALASSRFRSERTVQLGECIGESVRKGDRQDVDVGGTPCIAWPVRRFSASTAVRAIVFRFGRSVPNHQLQRTRSGGLRPPTRAAELRRSAYGSPALARHHGSV
jgi:hypothetical protein